MKFTFAIIALAAFVNFPASAQAAGDPSASRHPLILATAAERPAVLQAIASSPDRTATRDAMQRLINPLTEAHAASPTEFLKTLPPFDEQGERHRHTLGIAIYAAAIHYLTENEAYARLAADILHTYLSEIARREPGKIQLGGTGYDPVRYLHERIALTYDLVHPFLIRPGTTVSDPASGKQIPYDDSAAQKALHHLILDGFGSTDRPDRPGRRVSNHVQLNAYGCIFPIFCLKDEAERERLFDIFWKKGATKQGAFLTSYLAMYTRHGQGILPESSSYGTMMPFGILTTIDRLKPEMKVFVEPKVREILEEPFLFPQWVNSDGRSIGDGDGKRKALRASSNLMSVLEIAHRMGDADLERRANASLSALSENKLGVAPDDAKKKPGGGIGTRDYYAAVALLRPEAPAPRDPSVPGEIDYGRTLLIKHAGIAFLKNWVKKDNVDYGLSGYIGGGHYVHSHCTGIGMELYGGGYDRRKTQILAIRQNGEAWDEPFALVLEPTADGKPTVASVKHLTLGGKVVGVEVKSIVGSNTLTDVTLENDKGGNLSIPDRGIELEGRFAIIRTEQNGATRRTSLYLGAGERLRSGAHDIKGGSEGKAFRAFDAK